MVLVHHLGIVVGALLSCCAKLFRCLPLSVSPDALSLTIPFSTGWYMMQIYKYYLSCPNNNSVIAQNEPVNNEPVNNVLKPII